MRVLLVIPHIFNPKKGSIYASEQEEKRESKIRGLVESTLGNIARLSGKAYIHASTGKGGKIETREIVANAAVDMTVRVYTDLSKSLVGYLSEDERLEIVHVEGQEPRNIPLIASRSCIQDCEDYDFVGYIEDDISIEDRSFFEKLRTLELCSGTEYAFMPHRCEYIDGKGDVLLSGDPDGGRPDLFWATGEALSYRWLERVVTFYRAVNPHSGCYFLSRKQAMRVREYWNCRKWKADFELAGPLEQAASGILVPVLKIMKPLPSDYRFFMVRHNDNLWKRHI